MIRSVRTYLLPQLLGDSDLSQSAAVVIDILRATTTVSQALAAGATAVLPCLTVEQARELAVEFPDHLLGGERGGEPISGFDFGNSPLEYQSDKVNERRLIFTTTNGTRAVEACRGAKIVYLGAFVNLARLVDVLSGTAESVALVCSGTDGEVTREDTLFAGAVIARLCDLNADLTLANDQSRLALDAWLQCGLKGRAEDCLQLAEQLQQSQGGRNLLRLGRDADIVWAAGIDRLQVLPVFEQATNTIRAASLTNS